MDKIRVLIVDDSLLFRESLSNGLGKFDFIDVVGTACDPFEARDKILKYKPDAVTLDVEMPKMDGIKFLKKLLPSYPIPVIVISSLKESVFEAMNAGALDFVGKPLYGQDTFDFMREVAAKIRGVSKARVVCREAASDIKLSTEGLIGEVDPKKLIVIGASTGGTEAIYSMLTKFSVNMPGMVIVQHMPAGFTKLYADRLNNACELTVKEAENNDIIEPGRILIAPGDFHTTVQNRQGIYVINLERSDKVNGHRPSVDVLFESVARNVGADAIGVILTGMGSDGAEGLSKMREAGAYTIGQDEKSSVIYGMPMAAYKAGAVVQQSPLFRIPDCMIKELSRTH